MSVYNDTQIRQAIENGHIVCHPFLPAHLRPVSLDVTLGYHYYRIEKLHERAVYNPFDKEAVERYFDGPYKALAHGEWCALNGLRPVTNIPSEHPVISLKPGERILAHSHEFLGILSPGAAEIKPQLNWERNGVAVCASGSWVSPGQINRLTLEIHNRNEHETILLPVGERIAQVIFYETGASEAGRQAPADSGDDPNRQRSRPDLATIIRVWSPDMLLPTAYQDQRTMPRQIEGLAYE